MIGTNTISQTTAYTEARARYVMDKIFEDFTALIIRGFATQAQITKWKEDLLYLMHKEVLDFFEIQLKQPNGTVGAMKYIVKPDNSLSEDSSSGSLGLYGLPLGTKANLFAQLHFSSPNYTEANNELHNNRGWGIGKNVDGVVERHHAYSKDGYGIERNKIGTW